MKAAYQWSDKKSSMNEKELRACSGKFELNA